jgi:hypothetical protein
MRDVTSVTLRNSFNHKGLKASCRAEDFQAKLGLSAKAPQSHDGVGRRLLGEQRRNTNTLWDVLSRITHRL